MTVARYNVLAHSKLARVGLWTSLLVSVGLGLALIKSQLKSNWAISPALPLEQGFNILGASPQLKNINGVRSLCFSPVEEYKWCEIYVIVVFVHLPFFREVIVRHMSNLQITLLVVSPRGFLHIWPQYVELKFSWDCILYILFECSQKINRFMRCSDQFPLPQAPRGQNILRSNIMHGTDDSLGRKLGKCTQVLQAVRLRSAVPRSCWWGGWAVAASHTFWVAGHQSVNCCGERKGSEMGYWRLNPAKSSKFFCWKSDHLE